MTNSTRDGLGFEELGQAGSQFSSLWMTGSLLSEDQISGANIYSTARSMAGSFVGPIHSGANFLGSVFRANGLLSGAQANAGSIVGPLHSGADGLFTNLVASTAVSGGQLLMGGSALFSNHYFTPGSPYLQGNIERFTAETIISGGMWVTLSGAAGGANVRARAAAVSTTPLGVAIATAGSNATVSVLTRGYVYLTADTTIDNATQIRMGAGGALNTVAQATAGSGARGVALAGAGSEGVALVYLW